MRGGEEEEEEEVDGDKRDGWEVRKGMSRKGVAERE